MPRPSFALLLLALTTAAPAHADDRAPLPAPSRSLEADLAQIASDRLFKTATVGVQVVNVRTGEEVFARSADDGMSPASTMKVVTAAAALRTLGPSYRFTTDLLTDGEVDAAGVLDGNLYVQGHGDPTLVIEKLWKLVYDLKLEGVQRVAGDLVFDESFFSTDYLIPGWDKEEDLKRGPSYFPTLSALSLNFNTATLVVAPGHEVGKPARVQLETPAGTYVQVENEAVTGAARSRRWVGLERTMEPGKVVFKVTGNLPDGAGTARYYRAVPDPTSQFAAAFKELMDQHGIAIEGRIKRGRAPSTADMLVHLRSPPLSAILMDMNKLSINFIAEQVLRALGAEASGGEGTTEAGLEVVYAYLDELGIERDAVHLVNGSGLSRDIVLPPSVLTAVMVDMAANDQVGHEFAATLAIAGRDGTLWRRLRDDPGRLRGKTGTIDGVHCLCGYVDAGDGERYAFAFMVNDLDGGSSPAKRLHDRFARALFSVSPPDGTAAAEVPE